MFTWTLDLDFFSIPDPRSRGSKMHRVQDPESRIPNPGSGSARLSNSHSRTFYLKLSIMSWKRLPPPVVSAAAAAAEVEGPPAPPLQLSCSFRSLHQRRRLEYKKRTDGDRRKIPRKKFRVIAFRQCSGSGTGYGSVNFWAIRIRIRNYLYGSGSDRIFPSTSKKIKNTS